jgi:hypothetical protein
LSLLGPVGPCAALAAPGPRPQAPGLPGAGKFQKPTLIGTDLEVGVGMP